MTIGILTSGGDAPGRNAVIAGACEQLERLAGMHGGDRLGSPAREAREPPADAERAYLADAVAAASGSAIAVMSEAVGDAVRIAEALATRAGVRVHPTILGHTQRAATPSGLDRAPGPAAGRGAVATLADGGSALVRLSSHGTAAPVPLLEAIPAAGSLDSEGAVP